MLSSVLNGDGAVAVNIQIMRVFTKVRQMLTTQRAVIKQVWEEF